MVGEPGELLRHLAAGDEAALRSVLAPSSRGEETLERRTRTLVALGALLATGATTTTLRWAVDLAEATGAGIDAVVAVLLTAAPVAGSAQLAVGASRLALALDLDAPAEI